MTEQKDFSAQLPNGQMFAFWEVEQKYEREIHVDTTHPHASDQNDGTLLQPFKTINSDDLTMVVVFKGTLPEVEADEKVRLDYFGDRDDGRRSAGPIIGLAGKKVRFNIDPRKINA